jgi:hypothetical protein
VHVARASKRVPTGEYEEKYVENNLDKTGRRILSAWQTEKFTGAAYPAMIRVGLTSVMHVLTKGL